MKYNLYAIDTRTDALALWREDDDDDDDVDDECVCLTYMERIQAAAAAPLWWSR